MREHLLILLLVIPIAICLSQVTTPTQGQCQAVCLNEYTSMKEFLALDGSGYREADAVNNSDFALCKLGCGSPGFTELKLEPFKRGQTVYDTIINQGETGGSPTMVSTSSPVKSVTLLCADSAENNGSVFWRVGLEVMNNSDDGMMAHWIEAVRRINDDVSTDVVVFSTWCYTSYVDFFGVVDVTNSSIQFRVSSFNGSGLMGPLMSSKWYTEEQLAGGNHIQMVVADELWKDELAAVRVAFKSTQMSSCSLVLTYNSHMGVEQRMEFVMDRSRGFLLDRLAFDHPYTLRLWRIGAVTTAYTSHEFRTPQCLKLVHDPALCAPPPVSDISWIWNSSENEGNRIVLSWTYGSLSQMVEDDSRVERRDSVAPAVTSFPRMVHFDIAINPLVTATQYQCQFLDVQRRVVTWTHRSVVLYVPNEHCNYGIEITVVDSRNRRSTTTKAQVIRFEEKYQMLLSADGWNTGVIVLSLIVLASFVTVSGGLVACRIRDHREWNTIKRSISPPSPGLTITRTASTSVVGVANKYALKERCPMRTVNMVRLSFSDDSETPVNTTPIVKGNSTTETSDGDDCFKALPVTPTTDDTEYDTIGTPKLTHNPCQTGRCSGGCLAATIITSVASTKPNTLAVPHDCLIVTRRLTRSPFSLWTTKHVMWQTTEQTFAIKYSQQGIGLLRREFKILNHISVTHPNLVRWLGVGVCSDQVLSLLFEPCSGGTLANFLDEAKKVLSHRTSFDMPSLEHKVHFLAYHLHRFALNVAQALVYLHDQGCTHSHITVENVYLALDYNDPLDIPCDQTVKLGDFCWASLPRVKCGRVHSSQNLLPPEISINGENYSSATDVWQYGLFLSSVITLNSAQALICLPPDVLLTDRIIKNYYTCLSSGIRQVDPYMSSLKSRILMCLTSNVRNRATMKKIQKELVSLDFKAPESVTGTNSVLV
uniref:non-specific serine/threonine protein kinase n=1 Tax=Haemonchus contortus TaxID=6289 RepID=A0A7I4YZD6_HAECO